MQRGGCAVAAGSADEQGRPWEEVSLPSRRLQVELDTGLQEDSRGNISSP